MNRATWQAIAILAVSLGGIASTQPTLARVAHTVKERDDVYPLPPPEELRAATLGWDAAAVDLLWATLLVEYGTHWSEHREFTNIADYVDAIIAIEPTYRPLYRIVDTLFAYRPMQGTEADVKKARAYLERGTRERPDDSKVWMQYGQFLAFVAPSFLHESAEIEAWRRTGAAAMAHAVELGGEADHALSAATLLTRAGATEQAIRYLTRIYELTPAASEAHQAIGRRLATLAASVARDTADQAVAAIDGRWHHELPFVSRDEYLLLGPTGDAAGCAGIAAAHEPRCPRGWSALLEAAGIRDNLNELGSSGDSP
jgi:tetratricopeptide (TPR) repeat protein